MQTFWFLKRSFINLSLFIFWLMHCLCIILTVTVYVMDSFLYLLKLLLVSLQDKRRQMMKSFSDSAL